MSKFLLHLVCLLAALLLLVPQSADAQERRVITHGVVLDGDTIPHVNLPEVRSFARRVYKNDRQRAKWSRFIYNVKKALPYARIFSRELRAIDDSLALIDSKSDREAYLDAKEKELFGKYENELKHLTVTQGRILIKLIARETGHTSYDLIRLLKGRFKAFWWQGIARVFGSNLKTDYDPTGDDKALEDVVLLIDLGVY